jgi:hypothetical protein
MQGLAGPSAPCTHGGGLHQELSQAVANLEGRRGQGGGRRWWAQAASRRARAPALAARARRSAAARRAARSDASGLPGAPAAPARARAGARNSPVRGRAPRLARPARPDPFGWARAGRHRRNVRQWAVRGAAPSRGCAGRSPRAGVGPPPGPHATGIAPAPWPWSSPRCGGTRRACRGRASRRRPWCPPRRSPRPCGRPPP